MSELSGLGFDSRILHVCIDTNSNLQILSVKEITMCLGYTSIAQRKSKCLRSIRLRVRILLGVLEKMNNRNAYMKERYAKRRVKAITQLGGKCIDCGLIVLLEFDHLDPAIKNASIANTIASKGDKLLQVELQKCVLRCLACHAFQTAAQRLSNVDLLSSVAQRQSS